MVSWPKPGFADPRGGAGRGAEAHLGRDGVGLRPGGGGVGRRGRGGSRGTRRAGRPRADSSAARRRSERLLLGGQVDAQALPREDRGREIAQRIGDVSAGLPSLLPRERRNSTWLVPRQRSSMPEASPNRDAALVWAKALPAGIEGRDHVVAQLGIDVLDALRVPVVGAREELERRARGPGEALGQGLQPEDRVGPRAPRRRLPRSSADRACRIRGWR